MILQIYTCVGLVVGGITGSTIYFYANTLNRYPMTDYMNESKYIINNGALSIITGILAGSVWPISIPCIMYCAFKA